MPNGKPGDHPLTDILVHGTEVYGPEADQLIRQIATLCSPRELDEWWWARIGWSAEPNVVLREAQAQYQKLRHRAKDHGWDGTP